MKLDELKPGAIFKDAGGFKYIKTAYETNGGVSLFVCEYDGKITILPPAIRSYKPIIEVTPTIEHLHDVAYRALETWEEDEQLRQAMEEAGEFIVECSKAIREGNTVNNGNAYIDALKRLREEAADMVIMIEQVKRITGHLTDKTFDDVLNEKIDKLETEIEDVIEQCTRDER